MELLPPLFRLVGAELLAQLDLPAGEHFGEHAFRALEGSLDGPPDGQRVVAGEGLAKAQNGVVGMHVGILGEITHSNRVFVKNDGG